MPCFQITNPHAISQVLNGFLHSLAPTKSVQISFYIRLILPLSSLILLVLSAIFDSRSLIPFATIRLNFADLAEKSFVHQNSQFTTLLLFVRVVIFHSLIPVYFTEYFFIIESRSDDMGRFKNRVKSLFSAPKAEEQPFAPKKLSQDQDDKFFADSRERNEYNLLYDKTLTAAGRAGLSEFPAQPPEDILDPIPIDEERLNHASLVHGHVQHNFMAGVQKGETASGYGDDFCQVHGITRVFVVDPENHLIAMCTPYRYMMFMANRMYSRSKFDGNIFEFGGHVVATPRWAMRAAAWQILKGQGGQIMRVGESVSISASRLDADGKAMHPQMVFRDVPYSGVSWIVMDKWFEDARSHKVSLVLADTGLSDIADFDRSKTLPLVIREDEADMFMGDPVRGLVTKDERFKALIESNLVNQDTVALQFRAGWYAPYNPRGVTRIMRILKQASQQGKNTICAKDGSGFWVPEEAYSKNLVKPPGHGLWVIGGVDDLQAGALAKEIGTHYDMPVNLKPDSGGFN